MKPTTTPHRSTAIGRRLALVCVTAVVGMLASCSKSPASDSSETAVDVATVERAVIVPTIDVTGQLRYAQQVALTAEVIGKVAEIRVAAGDRVEAGTVVITLDQKEIHASIEQQRASLSREQIRRQIAAVEVEQAQRKHDRVSNLFTRGFVGKDAREDAEHELERARLNGRDAEAAVAYAAALVRAGEEQLAKTEIRAPISGLVLTVDVGVGETAVPSTQAFSGATLMRIADPGSMYLAAQVTEAHIGHVRAGQRVHIELPGSGAPVLTGRVDQIPYAPIQTATGGLTTDTGVGTYDVGIALEGDLPSQVRFGLHCRASIALGDETPQLSVPVQAVVANTKRTGAPYFVWVLEGEVVRQVPVTPGVADDDRQALVDGPAEGTKVVTGPPAILFRLATGERVKTSSAR